MNRRKFLASCIAAAVAPSVAPALEPDLTGAGWRSVPLGHELVFTSGYEQYKDPAGPVPGSGPIQQLRRMGGVTYAMRSGVWYGDRTGSWEEVTSAITLTFLYELECKLWMGADLAMEYALHLKQFKAVPILLDGVQYWSLSAFSPASIMRRL